MKDLTALRSAGRRRVRVLLAIAAVAPLATGCFDGSDVGDAGIPDEAAAAAVPDSALASSTAYTQFTLTASQTASDTAEPLAADRVTVPPASETDEPVPVS